MANIVVVGLQWGDEGKGKIVDILSEKADVIVRFQGGPNAGHTVVIGNEKVILHQIPSGILHTGKKCVIGNGVVVDLETLFQEIDELKQRGFFQDDTSLLISEQSHLIMPYHKTIDVYRDQKRGKRRIGTTGRGIGPAYEDKVARVGIRIGDLIDEEIFHQKLKINLEEKNWYLREYLGADEIDFDSIYDSYQDYSKRISSYVTNTSAFIQDSIQRGENILFEGAQGCMLDVDHGTYPYVTSSNTLASQACTGSGIGVHHIDYILGVAKAYTTRVGGGPFPTELKDNVGEYLRKKGAEFGATTGRPRRCGWFDAVIARYAIDINTINGVALTKLDVLSGIDPIKVCIAYKYKGQDLKTIPFNEKMWKECTPVYEEIKGWHEDISSIKEYNDLPSTAKDYIKRIEELINTEVVMISVGERRKEAICIKELFS